MPPSSRRALDDTIEALDAAIAESIALTKRLTDTRVSLNTQRYTMRSIRQCACGAGIPASLPDAIMCGRCAALTVARAMAPSKPTTCQASQHSDQMLCGHCKLGWDMNDPDPPPCGISKK